MPLPTSAQFSFVLRVRIDHRAGMLGRVDHASAIVEAVNAVAGGAVPDPPTARS